MLNKIKTSKAFAKRTYLNSLKKSLVLFNLLEYTLFMKKSYVAAFYLLICTLLFSQISVQVEAFRDAMYNDPLNGAKMLQEYNKAVESAESALSGYSLYVELSRCEYYMGRSYFYRENNDLAGKHYDKGLEYAQKALNIKRGADALIMYAENLSQNCAVKPTSYAIANGLSIGGYAKEALKIEKNNAAAMYLLAAQNIYAPAPFHNHKKGIAEMKEILSTSNIKLAKDDEFNVTSSIAYGYIQRKEFDEALPWIEKALVVYPQNFFALDLKKQITENR